MAMQQVRNCVDLQNHSLAIGIAVNCSFPRRGGGGGGGGGVVVTTILSSVETNLTGICQIFEVVLKYKKCNAYSGVQGCICIK